MLNFDFQTAEKKVSLHNMFLMALRGCSGPGNCVILCDMHKVMTTLILVEFGFVLV